MRRRPAWRSWGLPALEALQLVEWCSDLVRVLVFSDPHAAVHRIPRKAVGLIFFELENAALTTAQRMSEGTRRVVGRFVFLTHAERRETDANHVPWPALIVERPFDRDGLRGLVARRLGLARQSVDQRVGVDAGAPASGDPARS